MPVFAVFSVQFILNIATESPFVEFFGEANFEAQTCRPIVTFEHGAYATYLYSAKVPGTGSCIWGQEAILSRQGLTLTISAPS